MIVKAVRYVAHTGKHTLTHRTLLRSRLFDATRHCTEYQSLMLFSKCGKQLVTRSRCIGQHSSSVGLSTRQHRRLAAADGKGSTQRANTLTSATSGDHCTGISSSTHMLTKPAHIVHVHHPLPLSRVALGIDGQYLMTYKVTLESGRKVPAIQWSAKLPPSLLEALTELPKHTEGVNVMALSKTEGDSDLWFLSVDDGYDDSAYAGPSLDVVASYKDMMKVYNELLADEDRNCIDKMCLAPGYGGYMEFWDYGTDDTLVTWKGLPQSLEDALDRYRLTYGGVDQLSVAFDGEWFVKYEDCFYQWDGVHPVLDYMLREQRKSLGKPKWVELGPTKSFVARFEHGTAWYAQENLTAALLSTAEPGWQSARKNTRLLAVC